MRVRDVQLTREPKRSIVPRVGHWHDNVRLHWEFPSELAPHFGAHFADVLASDNAVRARKIYILKHAKGRFLIGEWPLRTQPIFIDDQYFARLDLPDELGMNQIECACFGRENVSAVQFPKRQRAPAEWIAHGDQLTLAHDQEGKRALDSTQRA